ncbi:MAG: hypothetical protein ABI885_09660 [Gammaproteobacteria bacterium]
MSARKATRRPKAPAPGPGLNVAHTWPVIWRVVAPCCGSYNHDTVFLETQDEAEALERFDELRLQDYPVRMELVHCGSLPPDARRALAQMREANPQNAGSTMRPVLGFWEARS